jgi:hypothetical protein
VGCCSSSSLASACANAPAVMQVTDVFKGMYTWSPFDRETFTNNRRFRPSSLFWSSKATGMADGRDAERRGSSQGSPRLAQYQADDGLLPHEEIEPHPGDFSLGVGRILAACGTGSIGRP